MNCPKCKQEMRVTGVSYDFFDINLKTEEVSKPYENYFFYCDSCNTPYASYAGSRAQEVVAPKKTKEQVELEAKKEAQKAKMRVYYEKRRKEKEAAKEQEHKSLLALVNRDVGEIKSIRVEVPALSKPEKKTKKKGKLTDEEKKERAREYCRKRYQRLKAQKKN